MNRELTYMDCWHYVAPLLQVNTDFGMEVYVMIFNALKEAEKKRIAAAKARGVHFGRKERPLPENFPDVYTRWESKEITGTAAAKECGMPLSTFLHRAAIYSGKEADRPCP